MQIVATDNAFVKENLPSSISAGVGECPACPLMISRLTTIQITTAANQTCFCKQPSFVLSDRNADYGDRMDCSCLSVVLVGEEHLSAGKILMMSLSVSFSQVCLAALSCNFGVSVRASW